MPVKHFIYMSLILVTLGCLIFGKTLSFDFVPYDDPAFISENHFVSQGFSVESVRWAFLYDSQVGEIKYPGTENLWHPLTWLSHMLDVELFGIEKAGGHHGANVFLFLLTAPLVFWSCSRLLGNVWAGFFVALLWMVHPMKVESVAWVSARKDLLSGLFFWAAFASALKSLDAGKKWRWIGVGFFIAALLSKASVVVLPPLLVLACGYLKNEKKWDRDYLIKGFKQWWMWFVAAGVVAVITIVIQGGGSHDYFIAQSSLTGRLMAAGSGFWFYLYRVLVPFDLNFYYHPAQLSQWVHLISWSGLFALGSLAWVKRRSWKVFFIGFVWFIICWLPVSGIIYVGASYTADRYIYLALAGILFPCAKYLSTIYWGRIVALILGLFWVCVSWKQVDVWRNGWTLFTHSTIAQPKATIGWSNLGTMQDRANKLEDAKSSYQKAIELDPSDYGSLYNLGVVESSLENKEQASQYYEKALKVYPLHYPSALKLGLIKKQEGDLEGARELFYLGVDKNITMLLLACECEILLKQYDKAEKLMKKVDGVKVREEQVMKNIQEINSFLKHRAK